MGTSEFHARRAGAALFLQCGLPSTLIHHKIGAFRKRSSNWRNLKSLALRFSVHEEGNYFENGAFRKWCSEDNHPISLTEFSSNTNPKWSVIFCAFQFLRRSVDAKHLKRFHSETYVFKFLRRGVDEAFNVFFVRKALFQYFSRWLCCWSQRNDLTYRDVDRVLFADLFLVSWHVHCTFSSKGNKLRTHWRKYSWS